jgi:hypothetical protein
MPQDPLAELLQHISHGPPRTLAELAGVLDVSPDLIEMMLADLERGGYLVALEAACEGGCTRCAHSGHCGLRFAGKLWTLTEKGSRRLTG